MARLPGEDLERLLQALVLATRALSLEGMGGARAAIRVRDTGTGIGPEVLPRLFEPFSQADRTLDRTKGGLGLGLALVKAGFDHHLSKPPAIDALERILAGAGRGTP